MFMVPSKWMSCNPSISRLDTVRSLNRWNKPTYYLVTVTSMDALVDLHRSLIFQDVGYTLSWTQWLKLKHVTLNNWTCHPFRWGTLGKTHPFMKFHLSCSPRYFSPEKTWWEYFGFLGIPIFTCPLKLQNPTCSLAEQAPTYMGNYDDKKGNPIFSTRFMVKAHLSNKYSHHILLESLQLFSMFFCSFYSIPGHVLRLLNVTIGFQLFLSFGKW